MSEVVKQCPVCGKVFVTRYPWQVYCSRACKREADRDYTVMVSRRYVLVHDPLPWEKGGFSPGVRFSGVAVREMLKHGALLPGTVLRRSDGKVFVVAAREDGALALEARGRRRDAVAVAGAPV